MRTIAEINDKIAKKTAVVWTVEELKSRVSEMGIKEVFSQVDVVCTGTFEPMESSGAIINCWLDGIPAYAGFGAVDLYLGASAISDLAAKNENLEGENPERGGGHIIEDLIAGKSIQLRAVGQATDCYPRTSFETIISKETINQFYLFNPRNLYQNFIVGVNGGERTLYTYLGPLQPRLGNAVYSNPGAISPLLNDPDLEAIGIGTRLFLGGGIGYIAWEGTQHFPLQKRLQNRTPIGPASTLALIGDAKQMNARWVRGCYFKNYGASLMLGVAVPIPILSEEIVRHCAVKDEEIVAPVVDFSGLITYAKLKSGRIMIEGKSVKVAPLASISLAREAALELKALIESGEFTLTEPVAKINLERTFIPQDRWGGKLSIE